jgi:cobalt/nickel transport protein
MKKKHNLFLVIGLLALAVIISVSPLFLSKNKEFGGSDDKGNDLIEQNDPNYKVWAEPIIEKITGSELSSEVETTLFCVQTGIGVGVIAFFMGRFYERKKLTKDKE